MSETGRSFGKLRDGYKNLDGADKILFWVHIVVAPILMVGAAAYALGLGPAVVFTFGLTLWLASKP